VSSLSRNILLVSYIAFSQSPNVLSLHDTEQDLHPTWTHLHLLCSRSYFLYFLESVFGSIQLNENVIDTFPEEGIIIQYLLHEFTADSCKMLHKLGHTRFLPNPFGLFLFSSFQTLDWMLAVRLDIQIFRFHKLFTTLLTICRYTPYTSKRVKDQTLIFILIATGD